MQIDAADAAIYGLNATIGSAYGGLFEKNSSGGAGVYGRATATTGSASGVEGKSAARDGRGVYGRATAASGFAYGVEGPSASSDGRGVNGIAAATSGFAYGVEGRTARSGGVGVYGVATAASSGTVGVQGSSASSGGVGVYGVASAASGAIYGVAGVILSPAFSAYGVVGQEPTGGAGHAVYAFGTLAATGTKSFQIDHPLRPETHYLNHFCIEASEPYNAYSGNVVTDAQGYATVQLPDYFERVNRDFRYQLTVIDDSNDFVQAKVARKIQNS